MPLNDASERARELWARLPIPRIGRQLESLVVEHIDLVRRSISISPPSATAYCLALNPVLEYDETDEVTYAYGLQADRAALLAKDDAMSVWNAGFFNDYFDAVAPKPAGELQIRRQLNDNEGIVEFDYWLLCEVARRLNELNAAPADATDDFVFFYMDHEFSEDFQLGLAYSTPPTTYQQFANRGLVQPEKAIPWNNWLDFGLEHG